MTMMTFEEACQTVQASARQHEAILVIAKNVEDAQVAKNLLTEIESRVDLRKQEEADAIARRTAANAEASRILAEAREGAEVIATAAAADAARVKADAGLEAERIIRAARDDAAKIVAEGRATVRRLITADAQAAA